MWAISGAADGHLCSTFDTAANSWCAVRMTDKTHGEIDINGTPKQIMDAIADLEANEGVKSVKYLERYPDGRPKTVEMEFEKGPIAGTMILDYTWDEPSKMSWKLAEGKLITKWDGEYEITPNTDGSNKVTYRLEVDISIPMIGQIKQKAAKQVIKYALPALKERVEG